MSTSAAPECGCLSRKTTLTQSTCPTALLRSDALETNVYEDYSDSMEEVVVEECVRAHCKRFVIKGNGICDSLCA
jgi:hypothetical protein